jgi:hypothetical protein
MSEQQSSADSAELEARLALADELMLPGGTHPYLGARKRAMIVAALRARAEPQTASGERLYTLKEATTALEQAIQALSLPHAQSQAESVK